MSSHRIVVSLVAAALVVSVLLFPGCGRQRAANGKPVVASTIFCYYDILRSVGGDKVDAVIFLPPRTSPHDFDPSVQSKEIATRARLIVKNGLGLDDWVNKLAASNPSVIMLNISQAIEFKTLNTPETSLDEPGATAASAPADHEETQVGNPHIWLDPRVQMAATEKIRDALIQLDPADKDYFTANAAAYLKGLRALDADFAAAAAKFTQRDFIGFHSAYDYLAHRYGLRQVAAIEEIPEQGITPAQARRVIELIKAKHIKVIFTETALPSKDADLIVRQNRRQARRPPAAGNLRLSDRYLRIINA